MTGFRQFVLLLLLLKEVLALRDVVLKITPEIVQKSHNATLHCSYDLEGASLYYVKWYRGNNEFYRYTLSEHPPTKVFPLGGIKVDMNRSNDTQVVLLDIDFLISGNFSCEVTTDEEPARTGTDVQTMTVVQLPSTPPAISVGWEPLDYGDTLRANCTSTPARPPASLTFVLNNFKVASSNQSQAAVPLWSDLVMELELKEYHFNRGKLVLRCVAQISDIYHEEAVLELQSARDPVPAKVSAVNSANSLSSRAILQSFLFFIIIRY